MLGTDSLVDVVFLLTLKTVQHIPAENIQVVRLSELIPEMFEQKCGVCVTFRPQQRSTFSASGNAAMFSFHSPGCLCDEITCEP
jgi:hypothetical protein